MQIPGPQTQENDIFSYGFDRNLNRANQGRGTGVVYDAIEEALNAGQVLSGGNLNVKTLTIGGLTRQVAPGDDLQAAINAVNREGGGTVQLLAAPYILQTNIELKSNVILRGVGKDITVIDFENRGVGIYAEGSDAAPVINFGVSDLTLKRSSQSAGALYLNLCNDFFLQNIKVTHCVGDGIKLDGARKYYAINIESNNHTGHGVQILGSDADGNSEEAIFLNCVANENGGSGFYGLTTGAGTITKVKFVGCETELNTRHGFALDVSENSGGNSFTNCLSDSNSGDGFTFKARGVKAMACISNGNSGTAFVSLTTGTAPDVGIFVGCFSDGGASDRSFYLEGAGSIVGCSEDLSINPPGSPSGLIVAGDTNSQIVGNNGANFVTRRVTNVMQNKSGATLRQGSVVVFASAASGQEMTTTTTNGSNKVIGMVNESGNTANDDFGSVLYEGKTTLLFVNNSAASIAIGDWLSTYSHAYYAKKAIAGDTAFAIALEAPTTGTAQIDAVLMTPRLI